MDIFELNKISPRSLFNKIEGHQRAKREEWRRTRLQCYYAFSPIDPADPSGKTLMSMERFMPFTWEGEEGQSEFDMFRAQADQARKEANEQWAELDNNKNRDVEQ